MTFFEYLLPPSTGQILFLEDSLSSNAPSTILHYSILIAIAAYHTYLYLKKIELRN